jgi:hypothetical protein
MAFPCGGKWSMRGIGVRTAHFEPIAKLSHFAVDEVVVVEGVCKCGDALGACKNMHGQRVSVAFRAERSELLREPGAEECEDRGGLVLRGMIEFRKFRAECADGAAVQHDLRLVGDKDADEAANALYRRRALGFPLLEHLARVGEAQCDDRIQDLVLGFEVIVEIAARDLYGFGYIGERGVLVAPLVKEMIRGFDDLIASGVFVQWKFLRARCLSAAYAVARRTRVLKRRTKIRTAVPIGQAALFTRKNLHQPSALSMMVQ